MVQISNGRPGAHMAELPTSPLPNARQERSSGRPVKEKFTREMILSVVVASLEDDSCHGPDPTGSKSPPLTEGIVGTHVHPPSPSTNLTRPRDPTYPLAPQANRRAPPFPLLPQSDDIKAGTHHDPVAIPPPAEGQPTAPKIRNPRRRRQFMRWVKKKFTGPWSLASPHDPSHGKNAAKRAVNQGL